MMHEPAQGYPSLYRLGKQGRLADPDANKYPLLAQQLLIRCQ